MMRPRKCGVLAFAAALLFVVFAGESTPAQAAPSNDAAANSSAFVHCQQQRVEVLEQRNQELEAKVLELKQQIAGLDSRHSRLQGDFHALVVATTVQRARDETWRKNALAKVQQAEAQCRLRLRHSSDMGGSTTSSDAIGSAATQVARALSSGSGGSCTVEPHGPLLAVHGACTCAGGLVVAGRNVTAELDALWENNGTGQLRSGGDTEEDCLALNTPVYVGSVVDDSTSMDNPGMVASSPDSNFLYVTGSLSHSLAVVNITNKAEPAVVGLVTSTSMKKPSDVALSPDGRTAYVPALLSNALVLLNVTEPTNPYIISSVSSSTFMNGAIRVTASPNGSYVYVTGATSDSLAVVNVTDPLTPTVLGGVTTQMTNPQGIARAPDGRYVYVTGRDSSSVTVVDVQNPSAAAVAGRVVDSTLLNSPRGAAVSPSGEYVYVVGATSNTFVVVNVSAPQSPVISGSLTGDSTNFNTPLDIVVSRDGTRAYVSVSTSSSIVAVNIEDPTAPTIVGSAAEDLTQLDAPSGLAISHDDRYFYATGFYNDGVAVMKWRNCVSKE